MRLSTELLLSLLSSISSSCSAISSVNNPRIVLYRSGLRVTYTSHTFVKFIVFCEMSYISNWINKRIKLIVLCGILVYKVCVRRINEKEAELVSK